MTLTDPAATLLVDSERPVAATVWTEVCRLADLEPLWGEAALVGSAQVALFLLPDGRLFAVDNADPATGAFVMSRGIVGSRGETPTIASPLHKDVFELASGACLTRPGQLRLPTWRVRVDGGIVSVASGTALVAASHGTSDPVGRRAVSALVAGVRAARPELTVHESFVDVQQPDVPEVLGAADADAAAVVVPLLLSAGYHVHVDLAEAADGAEIPTAVAGALGPDPRLAEVLVRRLHEAGVDLDDPRTRVVLAAAGSSDAGAVADCRTMGALLAERLGRPVSVGFVSAAQPRIADAVAAARSQASGHVAVATYLLAPGYFAELVGAAGADVVTAPLLRADAPPPEELVQIVLDRFDAT
jgi:NAD(P)H-dependent nitrite reductase small subunit